MALTELISKAPISGHAGWIMEMHAMLDGMPGHVHATAAHLADALCEYMANGASEQPNLRHFKTYVDRAKRGLATGTLRTPKPNAGEQTFLNAKQAVEDL